VSQEVQTALVHQELAGIDPGISREQASAVARYIRHLLKWNQRTNLVGPDNWRTVLRTLVADSVHLCRFLTEAGLPPESSMLDIGAGAGLPGVPLRIFRPHGVYVMVEPNRKKAVFLRFVLAQLGVGNTWVVERRVQELQPEEYAADLVLSRAFRDPATFADTAAPFVKTDGHVLVFAASGCAADEPVLRTHRLVRQWGYAVQGKGTRYFWLLVPRKASS
jgi:16S rRNA (guanine527-N7)-methyltransferase